MDLPALATCSFTGYTRDMGTPVRIALGAPRFIKLPNPAYYPDGRSKWLYVSELAPGREYLKAGPGEFVRHYTEHLHRNAAQILAKLRAIPSPENKLVLLCFEKHIARSSDCHRRVFAEWAAEHWGIEVPELGGGR